MTRMTSYKMALLNLANWVLWKGAGYHRLSPILADRKILNPSYMQAYFSCSTLRACITYALRMVFRQHV